MGCLWQRIRPVGKAVSWGDGEEGARDKKGRQNQHHGDGEGSRKGGQGPGPCMGAGGKREQSFVTV